MALNAANEDFKESFTRDLLIETTGAEDQMLKYLPSPQIEELILRKGLEINRECLIKLVENLDW
ncbi:MAG: hypothetical protein CME32_18665 [Gimesia sp.]|nr:hypothetical protein [Gimesia sp.]